MKRRYIIAPACLAVSFTLLLAACSSTGPSASTPTPAQPSATPETVVESPSVSPEAQALFTAGTWLSDGGQYYFFDGDGASGRTASLEDGTGVGFTYTLSGTQAVFAMGGADDESPCTVSRDGDAITLEWADGTTEQLTYVSEQGSDTFRFYSNQELAELALTYYKQTSGAQDGQDLTSPAQTNEDGSVSIQVYENLGDHNSTAAWYTVDRITAAGTDSSGGEVDLAG